MSGARPAVIVPAGPHPDPATIEQGRGNSSMHQQQATHRHSPRINAAYRAGRPPRPGRDRLLTHLAAAGMDGMSESQAAQAMRPNYSGAEVTHFLRHLEADGVIGTRLRRHPNRPDQFVRVYYDRRGMRDANPLRPRPGA